MKRKVLAGVVLVLGLAALGGGYLALSQSGRQPGKDYPKKNTAAMGKVSAYRVTSVSSGKGTRDVMELQLNGSDLRFHTIEYDGDKVVADYTSIGDTTYAKDLTDGKWWRQTTKPEDKEKSPEFKIFDRENLKKEVTYKFLGTEACSNLNCYKYEQVVAGLPEGSQELLWFDDKDYLTRKTVSGYGEFLSTREYSYDNISVTAPSSVKDVPEGKSIYQYLSSPSASGAAVIVPVSDPAAVPSTPFGPAPAASQSTEKTPSSNEGGE